jgi:hypothetical protein
VTNTLGGYGAGTPPAKADEGTGRPGIGPGRPAIIRIKGVDRQYPENYPEIFSRKVPGRFIKKHASS